MHVDFRAFLRRPRWGIEKVSGCVPAVNHKNGHVLTDEPQPKKQEIRIPPQPPAQPPRYYPAGGATQADDVRRGRRVVFHGAQELMIGMKEWKYLIGIFLGKVRFANSETWPPVGARADEDDARRGAGHPEVEVDARRRSRTPRAVRTSANHYYMSVREQRAAITTVVVPVHGDLQRCHVIGRRRQRLKLMEAGRGLGISLEGNAGTCQVPCNGIGKAQPWKAGLSKLRSAAARATFSPGTRIILSALIPQNGSGYNNEESGARNIEHFDWYRRLVSSLTIVV
ncbi:hypothetical protein B0H14DRAFT_2557385 [Mycena olivaceomarginata]|nr:hypothetical protein B0H14DRAFT_2557385 [Mycena olivaceomarginata]